MGEIGPRWSRPKSLTDARQMADIIIGQTDPEWLLGLGMDLLGVQEAKEWVVRDRIGRLPFHRGWR